MTGPTTQARARRDDERMRAAAHAGLLGVSLRCACGHVALTATGASTHERHKPTFCLPPWDRAHRGETR